MEEGEGSPVASLDGAEADAWWSSPDRDVAQAVLKALGSAREVAKLAAVSCAWRERANDDELLWRHYVHRDFRCVGWAVGGAYVTEGSGVQPPPGFSWRVLYQDAAATGVDVHTVLGLPLGCSSVDRAEESPTNTLEQSRCYGARSAVEAFWTQGCRCADPDDPEPCYWSSSGKADPDSEEFIVYRNVGAPVEISGLVVVPYRALWQPIDPTTGQNPIYAPKRVRLSAILKPDLELADDILNRRTTVTTLPAEWAEEIGTWDYPAGDDELRVTFERPVLLGTCILLLELFGKHQRQTFPGIADDFYTCLNHVYVPGRALVHHFMPSCEFPHPVEVQTHKARTCRHCAKEGCSLLCGGCRNAFFCSQECQRLAWPMHKGLCMALKRRQRGAPNPGRSLVEHWHALGRFPMAHQPPPQ